MVVAVNGADDLPPGLFGKIIAYSRGNAVAGDAHRTLCAVFVGSEHGCDLGKNTQAVVGKQYDLPLARIGLPREIQGRVRQPPGLHRRHIRGAVRLAR